MYVFYLVPLLVVMKIEDRKLNVYVTCLVWFEVIIYHHTKRVKQVSF
jgi:hypothetical protein